MGLPWLRSDVSALRRTKVAASFLDPCRGLCWRRINAGKTMRSLCRHRAARVVDRPATAPEQRA
jgi:hypothetical protein